MATINIDSSLINISMLPENLQALIDVVGISSALKFVECYGGLVITIPVKPVVGHKYESALGRENFIAFCKMFGGDTAFYVPKVDKIISQMKQHMAQEMSKQNMSAKEIALQLDISQRHAQRIKGDCNRYDLFGDGI